MARKICYKVIVRIYELFVPEKESLMLYNEGYVIIENEFFEGFLTNDLITGVYENKDKTWLIEILDYNNPEKSYIYSTDIEKIQLPGEFLLESEILDDNTICCLEFVNIETASEKQEEIEGTLQKIRQIHNFED